MKYWCTVKSLYWDLFDYFKIMQKSCIFRNKIEEKKVFCLRFPYKDQFLTHLVSRTVLYGGNILCAFWKPKTWYNEKCASIRNGKLHCWFKESSFDCDKKMIWTYLKIEYYMYNLYTSNNIKYIISKPTPYM